MDLEVVLIMDWMNGLVGAGIFFVGFFVGRLSGMKEFNLKKKNSVNGKAKAQGVMDTGISTTEEKEVVNSKADKRSFLPPNEVEVIEKMADDVTRNDLATELNKAFDKETEIKKEVEPK